MDSIILEDIKKMLGIDSVVNEFDVDILSGINSSFFTLYQLGVGLKEPIQITDITNWSEIETTAPLNVIRDYIYLKVRMTFDPPQTSFVMDAIKNRISELEFRLNINCDNGGGVIYG